jgi:hypothetical protein
MIDDLVRRISGDRGAPSTWVFDPLLSDPLHRRVLSFRNPTLRSGEWGRHLNFQHSAGHRHENVTFRYNDYADGNATKVMRLDAGVFVGRFLQHVLPRHFTRLRSFGFLANTKKRERLIAIRAALRASPPPLPTSTEAPCHCPRCGTGQLVARVRLAPFTLLPLDTS